MKPLPKSSLRFVHLLLLLLAAALFACHYLRLSADFPNFSEWMDWSKYTDEGWYGDAAIRHYQLGHWFVDGDFNPAVALPVWPFLEAILFRFTGVSLVAARALTVTVFGGILAVSWLLLRRWTRLPDPLSSADDDAQRYSLGPEVGVLLLVVNPLCFVITRLAILEPLLILWTLLALLAASHVRLSASKTWLSLQSRKQWHTDLLANWKPVLALGLLLPAMILTKTTGLFLVPAIAFLLWAALDYSLVALVRLGGAAALIGVILWLSYFGLLVRPHYLLDYSYLFSANAYTGITLDTAGKVIADTVTGGNWMGSRLFATSCACIIFSLIFFTRLKRNPLIAALLLWAFGYAAFLAYHANLQPRYYLVVTVPLTLLVPVVFEQLILFRLAKRSLLHTLLSAAMAVLLLGIVIPQIVEIFSFLRNAQYTLVTAAREVHDYIARDQRTDPRHSPLVLSISGSDLSLMTGLPSIDDDFGTLELVDRVAKYRPGWYAAWNDIEDDKMDALTPYFHVERVAEFPAMDDPDRNLLILYKLTDSSQPTTRKAHGKLPRKPLRTRVGQQPSTNQLEH